MRRKFQYVPSNIQELAALGCLLKLKNIFCPLQVFMFFDMTQEKQRAEIKSTFLKKRKSNDAVDEKASENHFLFFVSFLSRRKEPKPKRFSVLLEMQGGGTFNTGLIRTPL